MGKKHGHGILLASDLVFPVSDKNTDTKYLQWNCHKSAMRISTGWFLKIESKNYEI